MYLILTWKWNHQVISPNVFNMDLWVQSGHAANYREDMFILEVSFFPIFINACLCKNVGWRPYLFILLDWNQMNHSCVDVSCCSCNYYLYE